MVLILHSVNKGWCDFYLEQVLRHMHMFFREEQKNLLDEKNVVYVTKWIRNDVLFRLTVCDPMEILFVVMRTTL